MRASFLCSRLVWGKNQTLQHDVILREPLRRPACLLPPSFNQLQPDQTDQFLIPHHLHHAKTASSGESDMKAEAGRRQRLFPSSIGASVIRRSLLSCLLPPKRTALPVFGRAEPGWIWRSFISFFISKPLLFHSRVYLHPLALPGVFWKQNQKYPP